MFSSFFKFFRSYTYEQGNMTLNLTDFVAGYISGVCGLLVGHPLDTIKVRQQALNSRFLSSTRRTYKYEGLRGFYKGIWFPLIASGPVNAVFFGTYASSVKIFESTGMDSNDPHVLRHIFYAGSFAGFVQSFIICPVELVKTVLQVKTAEGVEWSKKLTLPYTSTIDCIKGIYNSKGLIGLYRGYIPTLLRDVPACGCYMLTYEVLVHQCYPFTRCSELRQEITAGGLAGIISCMICLPFDVVKSRIQADPEHIMYKNMRDCFYKTYKYDGIHVFMRGVCSVCLRAFVVNAVIFVSYTKSLKF